MTGTRESKSYVLDTSAIFAFWNDERGADQVERILKAVDSGTKIYFSFMTLMEGKYQLWRKVGKDMAEEFERMIRNLPLSRVDMTDSILNYAAEIKATTRLSVADSWIIATAIETGSALVHKDPEFEQVKGRLEIVPLPYKK
ncbi:MAG: type II toxin-antitoxin system VapC family toxin [Syntrophaceae bacterium]|nr:type II toxin-antitoxin system VapC family toxin [Syntrophaceae bacterium]